MSRRWVVVAGVALLAVLAGGCGSDRETNTFLVVGTEMAFDAPSTVASGAYDVAFRNEGAVAHELAFRSPSGEVMTRRSIGASERTTMRVQLTPGSWELACHEIGHYEAGMRRQLTVTTR